MASKRLFDLPVTRGSFQLRGHVSGVESQNFYTEKETKTGNTFRKVNFGVAYDDHKSVYLTLTGMPRELVYFTKKDKNTNKTESKPVKWANRKSFNEDGFRMIGISAGLQQIRNEDGSVENVVQTLTDFDACEYLSAYLEDDMSVYVNGNLDFSSFVTNTGEVRRQINYVPSRIYSAKAPIDFDSDKYKPTHTFEQTIVYRGIEQEMDGDKATGRFIMSAYVVNYNSIEMVEFIVENKALASACKKYMKPYWSFTVNGVIEVKNHIDEVKKESPWGTPNPNKRVRFASTREMIVTGIDCDDDNEPIVDNETYTAKEIEKALKAIYNAQNAESSFGESDDEEEDVDWGTDGDSDNDDEGQPW